EDERIAFLETADLLEITHDSNRLGERFGIVEDAFVIEPDEAALPVAVRRVDLDRLQPAREFGITVHHPALDIGGPRDQRIAVPEPDGFAVPARHLLAEIGYLAVGLEAPTDVDARDEIVRVARHDLHERRRDENRMRLVRDRKST